MSNPSSLDKTFDAQTIEAKWVNHWENLSNTAEQAAPHYSMVIPPPNVTGSLHMGHAFQDTLMDILIRYHKMRGFNTLWQFGVDHAGIATQMVVERQLAQQNITRQDLGRDEFVQRVWEWKQQSGSMIVKQIKRLGTSINWERECFTMDPEYAAAVQQAFIELYNDELIYRGQRLVHWDPVLHTALSDLEVNHIEEQGSLWHIKYPLANKNDAYITIATTRPETLLGDTAVAVNPADPRYQHLIGSELCLPLVNRNIPIIADSTVVMDFGSGAVKITPAHDFNDYAIGKRHNLPSINIFTKDAKLNHNAPAQYQNLDRFVVRKQIIKDLEQLALIEKIEAHTVKIPRGDRSDAILEPYLTDQWFVKMAPLKTAAIAAVKSGSIKFVPETWENTFFSWMNILDDWCISRQLWWGHRIPAWHDPDGKIYVGTDVNQIRAQHKLADDLALEQDADVLDTWFSAALWPFASLGWPQENKIYTEYYPTSVLVTGFDIIFFWVARMIMFALKFTQQIPFHTVYIHGLIRDSYGQKMSKSKGNVLDPLDIIDGITLPALLAKRTSAMMQPQLATKIREQTTKEFPLGITAFGTDCLRFTFASLANTGRDINFDLQRTSGYRNFCNKLWNAARFVLLNINDNDFSITTDNSLNLNLNIVDRWIYSQLQVTIQNLHQHLANYRFDLAARELYEFTWEKFCDWYLEFSKPVLFNLHGTTEQLVTKTTLLQILDNILRLLHPFMPFITEEIWHSIAPILKHSEKSILQLPYPIYQSSLIDTAADIEIAWLQNFVQVIRNIKSELNISPARNITILIKHANAQDRERIQQYLPYLQALTKLSTIEYLPENSKTSLAATGIIQHLELFLPLDGLVDINQELARLKKQLTKQQEEQQRLQNKLNNAEFIHKAPAELVQKEQEKLQQIATALQKLVEKIQWLG